MIQNSRKRLLAQLFIIIAYIYWPLTLKTPSTLRHILQITRTKRAIKEGNIQQVELILGSDRIRTQNWPYLALAINSLGETKEQKQKVLFRQIIALLFNHRADINAQDEKGNSPLILASIYNELNLAQELIDRGAELNLQNHLGHTALTRAVCLRHFDITELLVKSKANLDLCSYIDGITALMTAAFEGDFETARLLIENGADIDAQDKDGTTALKSARFWGRSTIVELLAAYGAAY